MGPSAPSFAARVNKDIGLLDPETKKEVLVTIRELAGEGMTCILVTHEMGFAREVADHIYFTDGGVIVEHGPPRELLARHPEQARLDRAPCES